MFICGKVNAFLLVSVVTVTLAVLLQLLAVGLPNWLEVDQSTTKDTYYGLFQLCVSITNHEHVCRYYDDADVSREAWWEANAAFQMIGLLALVVSMILGYCALLCCKRRPLIILVAAILAFVAALFMVIGMIIFGAKSDAEDFHASFYLALFAVALSIVSGIFFMVAKHVQFA